MLQEEKVLWIPQQKQAGFAYLQVEIQMLDSTLAGGPGAHGWDLEEVWSAPS